MAKTGVLLVNLGTPDAPTKKAVRAYLSEFLSDPRVIDKPRWLWFLILHGIILRLRPGKSAKAYQKIWTTSGSPLLVYSRELAGRLAESLPQDIKVVLGMRYGNPSLRLALAELQAAKLQEIIVIPLYPQYSATTTATTFDAIAKVLRTWQDLPNLRFIRSYYDLPAYINALAKEIKLFWQEHGVAEKLIFSFHGLPERYIQKGDPYYQECIRTATLVASALNIQKDAWQVCFQSRVGIEPWLQPYLNKTLQDLPKTGIKSVEIVCPGFAVDCLETLEEVLLLNRETFLNSGGEIFRYIPALNANNEQINILKALINLP